MKKTFKTSSRARRQKRIRSKVIGTQERPRLSIYKSNTSIYAQIIDDSKGLTLVSASTLVKGEKKTGKGAKVGKAGNKTEAAKKVGLEIAKLAKGKNINKVVFDRGGFIYTGRVRALADGAREGGLEF